MPSQTTLYTIRGSYISHIHIHRNATFTLQALLLNSNFLRSAQIWFVLVVHIHVISVSRPLTSNLTHLHIFKINILCMTNIHHVDFVVEKGGKCGNVEKGGFGVHVCCFDCRKYFLLKSICLKKELPIKIWQKIRFVHFNLVMWTQQKWSVKKNLKARVYSLPLHTLLSFLIKEYMTCIFPYSLQCLHYFYRFLLAYLPTILIFIIWGSHGKYSYNLPDFSVVLISCISLFS